MKIKAIANICKQAKRILMYEDENKVQWVGDGYGIYPLFELPYLGQEGIFTIFDIPEKQRNKILFNSGYNPVGICLQDFDEGELFLKDYELGVIKGGMQLIPLQTQTGLIFINGKYLLPVSDINDIQLYERMSANGRQYVVIKSGMMIYGAVMPVDIVNDDLVDQIETLNNQCKIALENKKILEEKAMQNDDQLKISEFEL